MDIELNDDKYFLFDIVKQIKHFYETPVIFLTKKDYSDIVFNTMCLIRKTRLEESSEEKKTTIDAIVQYHLDWLHAVNDIEQFKRLFETRDFDREGIYEAISFTIDAMNHRLKYLHKYMDTHSEKLPVIDRVNLNADLEIVEEMHKDVVASLLASLKCFRNFDDDHEFIVKVNESLDQLLSWIDKIFDGLSMDLSKYINIKAPHLANDMTKTLQQIVDEFRSSKSTSAQNLLDVLKEKGRQLSTMIRCTAGRDLEMSKVMEKLTILEDRIDRLKNEPNSAALLALQRKKEFLEKRIESLENLKTTVKKLNEINDVNFDEVEDETCICEDYFQLRIFNHLLPLEDRERLVTELCYLWDLAVFGDKHSKSIIDILSATEMKEEFTDDLGTFFIDDNNRKIYKIAGDDTLYQANEKNELVPLTDDDEHTYFYDECGRHYVDQNTRERIYKAFASASEYVMDTAGVLLKIKEQRDGVTYYYDSFGRYYIDSQGKHIYRDEDSQSEYENDGLGNLVRIRSQNDLFEPCPEDACVSDDFRYLTCVVGRALRQCIAEVILHQPADPIKYLSSSLIRYRQNMEFRDKLAAENAVLELEREAIRVQEREAAEKAALEAALLAQGGSEASYDSNMVRYGTIHGNDDAVTSTPRTTESKVN